MSGGPLGFGAKTQGVTAQSTVESELMSPDYGPKEAVCLSNCKMEQGFKTFSSVAINCDSTGTPHLGGNATYSSTTERIALRILFLRELVQTSKSNINHVDNGNMLADVTTKYLGKVHHHKILHQVKEFSRLGLQAKDSITTVSTTSVLQPQHLRRSSGSCYRRRLRKLGYSCLTSTRLHLDEYNQEIIIYEV